MTGKLKHDSKRVALFIDVANVCDLDMDWIVRAARRLGQLEVARGYGNYTNWRFLSPAAERLFQLGVELRHAPAWLNGGGSWKDAADELMMCDLSEVLAKRPDIIRYVLCSGDAHFVPSVCQIRGSGREVIVIGPPDRTARSLARAANRCLIAPLSGIKLPLEDEFPTFDGGNVNQVPPVKVRHPSVGRNGDRTQHRYEVNAPPLSKPGLSTPKVAG